MSHAVSNQRLLALDDVSLDSPVVVSPLPKDTDDNFSLTCDFFKKLMNDSYQTPS